MSLNLIRTVRIDKPDLFLTALQIVGYKNYYMLYDNVCKADVQYKIVCNINI